MDEVYMFKAQIIDTDHVNGAYIKFPYDVKGAFGSNGSVKVVAIFDGYKFRGILKKLDTDCHILEIPQSTQTEIGKGLGDEIEVTIQKDNESRQEEIPEILKNALDKNPLAQEFFNTLTESQKKKYIKYITSAKKRKTAKARLRKTLKMLYANEQLR